MPAINKWVYGYRKDNHLPLNLFGGRAKNKESAIELAHSMPMTSSHSLLPKILGIFV